MVERSDLVREMGALLVVFRRPLYLGLVLRLPGFTTFEGRRKKDETLVEKGELEVFVE